MAKRTNKTSHVLNLLTAPTEAEDVEEKEEVKEETQEKVQEKEEPKKEEAQEKQGVESQEPSGAAPASDTRVQSPYVTVIDEADTSERLSGEIKEALTREALAEEGNPEPAADQADKAEDTDTAAAAGTAADTAKETAGDTVTETAADINTSGGTDVAADTAETAETGTDKAKAEDNSMEAPEDKTEPNDEEVDYTCTNVMEAIMERYKLNIADYGVCTCKRCQADVKALVLTRLPSKYIITPKNSVAPLLNYYENKYRVDIMGAIVSACIKVKESPRH